MTQATHSSWTLVTRASPAPAFDCFQRAKTEGDSLVPSSIIYQWTAWAWGYEGKAWEILTSVVPAPPPVCSMPILVVTSPSYLCHWTTLRHPRSGLGRPTAGLQSIPQGFCFGSERPNLSCRRRGREGGREGEEIRKGERKEERLCLPNLCLQDYTTQLTLDVYWTWWEGIHQLEAGSRKD